MYHLGCDVNCPCLFKTEPHYTLTVEVTGQGYKRLAVTLKIDISPINQKRTDHDSWYKPELLTNHQGLSATTQDYCFSKEKERGFEN